MRQEKLGHETVADAKKLQYSSLPPANIQTLRIRKLELDFYFSDKEIKYIFFYTFIDEIGVLTSRIN